MERRKFVIGLGSLAAGGAAATGTGAFSAMTADREANIDVVNDEAGLLGIEAGLESDIVSGTGDGQLEIAVPDDYGAEGLNDDAKYQLGYVEEEPVDQWHSEYDFGSRWLNIGEKPTEEYAFRVVNQDTTSHDITIEADFPLVDGGAYQPHFAVAVYDAAEEEQHGGLADSGGDGPEITVEDVSSGDAVYVSLLFDTRYVEIDDGSLSGSFTISAD